MWLLACAKAVLIYYTTSPNANSDVFSSRWIKVFYKNIYIIIIIKKKGNTSLSMRSLLFD